MNNPSMTVAECKKSISDSLIKNKMDSLHGWVLLASIADSGLLRQIYDEKMSNMTPSNVIPVQFKIK